MTCVAPCLPPEPATDIRRFRDKSAQTKFPVARLCDLVAAAVAGAFGVPLCELRAATRRGPVAAFARQSAMYLAHVVFGLSLTEVGRSFGRDRTTAAYACERIENLRDDANFDAMLDALADACWSLGQNIELDADAGGR